jgi:hypothetical protein
MSDSYTSAAGYISSDDITDSIVMQFISKNDTRIQKWLDLVDADLQSLAQDRGLVSSSITSPLSNAKVKEYAVCYFCYLVFRDNYGTNNVQVSDQEKHKLKLDFYASTCQKMRPTLTREMFLWPMNSMLPVNKVGGGVLWRG